MQYKLVNADYVHGGTQKDVYTEADIESTFCLLCGSTESKLVCNERGALAVVECNECHLIYTNPRPNDAEENYFGDASVFYEEGRLIFSGKKPHHRDRNYAYELRRIKRFKPSGKLLDIGANMGFFLRKAKEFGYDAEGVEPSPALAEIAREEFELTIHNHFFKKELFPENTFDIVTLIDVFEHVTKPQRLLQDVCHVLKDDGILCIKVPNGNYGKLKLRLARMMNREHHHDIFNAYEHVVHYTIPTLNKMLEKGGFKIRRAMVPLPIRVPVWANLVGHYYLHPSPRILDWKRSLMRGVFYQVGQLQRALRLKVTFGPDLMVIADKSSL